MSKIKRENIPPQVLLHLVKRLRERSITKDAVLQLETWLNTNPEVPNGDWFKRFQEFTVCGQGELVKTFLTPSQLPHGTEI